MRWALLTAGIWVWAAPAMAQVTADEVWAAWKGMTLGLSTREETRAGDVLTIKDATWLNDARSHRVHLPEIELRDTAEGVEIKLPKGSIAYNRWGLSKELDYGMAFAMEAPSLVIRVTGESLDTARYEFAAETFKLKAFALEDGPKSERAMHISLQGLKGHRALLAGANDLALSIDQWEAAQDSPDDEALGKFQSRTSATGVKVAAKLILPSEDLRDLELEQALAAGLSLDLRYRDEGMQVSFAQESGEQITVLNVTAGSVSTDLALGPKEVWIRSELPVTAASLLHDDPRDAEEGALHVDFGLSDAGLNYELKAPLAALADGVEGNEYFALGALVDFGLKLGQSNLNLLVSKGQNPGKLKAELAAGGLDLRIDNRLMDLGGNLTGLAFAGEGFGGMPALDLSLGEVTQRFVMPTGLVGEPAPMNILSRISDLRMSDAIWDQFDAGRIFPRDPVNLLIDLQSLVTLRVPLWEAEQFQNNGNLPIEFNSLKIAGLSASGFGVDVKGSGAAELDFSNVVTPDDIPAGNANLQLDLTGVQGLLDKMEQAGLLSGDELTGARMGLMMVAKAVAGEPDKMTSSMELRDGRVYLNGMMIR